MAELQLFSGNANPTLAKAIAKSLDTTLSNAKIDHFSDGESNIEILDDVLGNDVYIIQPTCAPVNENLIELCLMADAIHRSSANRVTAVIPYFGYARQDRRIRSHQVPISAKVAAGMLEDVGINRIITVELHSDQIQGFFNIPVENVFSTDLFLDDIKQQKLDALSVVSPDVGGLVRARAFSKRLEGSELVAIEKHRNQDNKIELVNMLGEVKDKNCVIIDDMVDTAGTLAAAANALQEKGAKSVHAYVSHPVLSGDSIKIIENSSISELVVSDSIELSAAAKNSSKIRVISIATLLAKSIEKSKL